MILRASQFAILITAMFATKLFAERPDSDRTLTVMTWNIRYDNRGDGENAWRHRSDWVAEIIKREQPDLLGCQEVLSSQLNDLEDSLTDYAVYGVGRDDGKRRGEFAPIFYRRERFELIDSSTFWLSPTPEKVGSKGWDAAITRIASWVKLKDKRKGDTFYAINTHFDHRGTTARHESAKLLAKQLREKFADHPVILTGDFNTTPGSAPYAALTKRQQDPDAPLFQDTIDLAAEKSAGPDSTWNGFQAVVPHRRIDFIFVSPQAIVQTHRTLVDQREGRFPSDHLPVVTTLELNEP